MSEIPTYPDEAIEREERADGRAKAREPGPKWFASGRGIFCRDAGFQLATMPLTVNWQEDTARIVDLLNKGAAYAALHEEAVADKALIRKLTDICPDCPPDVGEVGCETCDGSGVVPKAAPLPKRKRAK